MAEEDDYSMSLIRFAGFPPLFTSPDKKGCYHYKINDDANSKKTNHGVFCFDLQDRFRLFCIRDKCTDFRTRTRRTQFECSPVRGLSSSQLTLV